MTLTCLLCLGDTTTEWIHTVSASSRCSLMARSWKLSPGYLVLHMYYMKEIDSICRTTGQYQETKTYEFVLLILFTVVHCINCWLCKNIYPKKFFVTEASNEEFGCLSLSVH